MLIHHPTYRETNKKYWYTSSEKKRLALPSKLRTKFANKQIVCVEYEGLSADQERELFQVSTDSGAPNTQSLPFLFCMLTQIKSL